MNTNPNNFKDLERSQSSTISILLGLLDFEAKEKIGNLRLYASPQNFVVDAKAGRTLAILETAANPVQDETGSVILWIDCEDEKNRHTDLQHELSENWPDGIRKFRRSFTLAAWHKRRKELVLARDSVGSRPLYYSCLGEGIAFGSKLSDVVDLAGLNRSFNPQALSDYLTYLYIPFPKTVIRGVFKVPPGCYVLWREGKISIHRYIDFDLTLQEEEEKQAVDDLEERLDHSVGEMWGDDAGIFLSGGIDSTTVLAFTGRHANKAIPTFSLGFRDAPLYDEQQRVALLSNHFKTKHHQIELDAESISILPELVKHYDEPFGNATSLLIYELAKEARNHVSAVLTGDGGDELFAGYPRLAGIGVSRSYRRLPLWMRSYVIDPVVMGLPESLNGRHWLRRAREFVRGSRLPLDEMYVSWITYFSEQTKKRLLNQHILLELNGYDAHNCILEVMNKYPSNVELGAHYADLAFVLPCNGIEYVSKSTRANDLAVRSPFLDMEVISFATSLPMELKLNRRQPKYLLRQLAKRVLPSEVLTWSKIGFNSPLGIWLKKEPGRSMLHELLTPESVKHRGFLNWSSVDALVKEFFKGRRDISLEIWALMFLEAWCQEHLD